MEMHPKIAALFKGREAQYPKNLETKYPRVFLKIMDSWDTAFATAVIEDFLIDKRGGRQGFPPEALGEIVLLGRIDDRLKELRELKAGLVRPKDPWGQEVIKRGLAREQITYDQQGFFRAAELGNERALMLFIQAGVDTEVRNPAGWTPLIAAAYNGSQKGVSTLLTIDLKVDAKDGQGYTALHWAAFKGLTVITKLLLDGKANANVQSDMGLTPLHQAAMCGHLAVVTELIKGGAKIDEVNNDGWTPLHQAVADANVEVIKRLVAAGANLHIEDLRKSSPLNLAKRRNKVAVLAALGETP